MKDIKQVAEFMQTHSLVLVTAESCTAGLIAATLADVPGAGKLLDCAFVTYSVKAKKHCLGVSSQILLRYNLTSEEVARDMATGALERSHANIAIANTGVADDGGNGVPAGTQCFAWHFRPHLDNTPLFLFSETRRFEGNRHEIRLASAVYALRRIPHYYAKTQCGGVN